MALQRERFTLEQYLGHPEQTGPFLPNVLITSILATDPQAWQPAAAAADQPILL